MHVYCIDATPTHTSNMHSPQQYKIDEYLD